MTTSHSAFVGEIPFYYDKYLGPIIFNQYARDLSSRVQVPDTGVILETAAGTGIATRALRDILTTGVHIVATDLNPDMLEQARGKFAGKQNIEFQTGDAQQLPFDNDCFDAVLCQFSLMFFPDQLLAMQEAARVLKPGGALLFNVWDSFQHNHLARTANRSICNFLSDNPPNFFATPFGYYNIDRLKEMLFQAGFADIEISVVPRTSVAADARSVALGFVLGTPVRLQIEADHQVALTDIVAAVENDIGEEFGFKNIQEKMQAIVFVAQLKVDS